MWDEGDEENVSESSYMDLISGASQTPCAYLVGDLNDAHVYVPGNL